MATDLQSVGGWGSGDTSYDQFVKREGVPMVRSLWVEDVLNLPRAPWPRKGGRGAYINLDGSGINTSYIAIDCYVCWRRLNSGFTNISTPDRARRSISPSSRAAGNFAPRESS